MSAHLEVERVVLGPALVVGTRETPDWCTGADCWLHVGKAVRRGKLAGIADGVATVALQRGGSVSRPIESIYASHNAADMARFHGILAKAGSPVEPAPVATEGNALEAEVARLRAALSAIAALQPAAPKRSDTTDVETYGWAWGRHGASEMARAGLAGGK